MMDKDLECGFFWIKRRKPSSKAYAYAIQIYG